MMKLHHFLLLLAVLALAGCAGPGQPAVPVSGISPTATVNDLFASGGSGDDGSPDLFQDNAPGTATAGPGAVVTETPSPTAPQAQATVAQTATAGQPPETMRTVVVYDDALAPSWDIFSPGGMRFYAASTAQAHTGQRAIQVTPEQPESKIYIALRPGSNEVYERSKVLAVSLWLYSGEEELDLYDLAITAIGSNEYPYYLPEDRSGEDEKPYEETFLYWLGFNSNIPARTWVEVQVWLDDMLYDPYYKYVTGFYLTNRYTFKRTFYIDDVSLILLPGDPEEPVIAVPPTPTLSTITPTWTTTATLAPTETPAPTATRPRLPTRTATPVDYTPPRPNPPPPNPPPDQPTPTPTDWAPVKPTSEAPVMPLP